MELLLMIVKEILSKRCKGKNIIKNEYISTVTLINTFSNVIQVVPKIIKRKNSKGKDIIKYTHDNAFLMMYKQAEQCFSNKLLVKKYNKSNGNVAFRTLVYVINGVGPKTAKLIVDELNLKTFKDVLNINYDDLIVLNSIGNKTTSKIIKQIGYNV